jgi:polyisoprenoid-binding protein YceI
VLVTVLLLASVVSGATADRRPIDTSRSHVLVRVYKAGLFSGFAHNHEIEAPIASGSVEPGAAAGVTLRIDAARLRVLDPEVSSGTRAEIQRTMLGPKVLDAARFPEIRFQSQQVTATGGGHWRIQGRLTLHGETRPVTLEAAETGGAYRGAVSLRQTDFGITPIRLAGGTVRVKDRVRIEFEIRLGDSAGSSGNAGTKLDREGGTRP